MQNALKLDEFGVTELNHNQMVETEGGGVVTTILIGVGIVVGISAINGLYDGLMDSYEENNKSFRGSGASGSW